jgi:hypothetical protein
MKKVEWTNHQSSNLQMLNDSDYQLFWLFDMVFIELAYNSLKMKKR